MTDYTDIKPKISDIRDEISSLLKLIEDSYIEMFPSETEKIAGELKRMSDKLYKIEEHADRLADAFEDEIARHDRFMDLISQDNCR